MTNTDTKKSVVENTTEQAGSQDRTRTWLFIAYPESVPEKWEEILTDYGVPWGRSPLHDSDKNGDGASDTLSTRITRTRHSISRKTS